MQECPLEDGKMATEKEAKSVSVKTMKETELLYAGVLDGMETKNRWGGEQRWQWKSNVAMGMAGEPNCTCNRTAAGRPGSMNRLSGGTEDRRTCAQFTAIGALKLAKAWVIQLEKDIQPEETLWVGIAKIFRETYRMERTTY